MRMLEEILYTGPVNSDEQERVRAAGYVWKACRWCAVITYVSDDHDGLCRICSHGQRSAYSQERTP